MINRVPSVAVAVLLPQTADEPQTAENPEELELPQTAEEPQTADEPQTALDPETHALDPHTALLPQTADDPQTAEDPHTAEFVFTTVTVFVAESKSAFGDAAAPSTGSVFSVWFSAAHTSRYPAPTEKMSYWLLYINPVFGS